MNILITINKHYIEQAKVMLFSLKSNHQNQEITVYLLHRSLSIDDIATLKAGLESDNFIITAIKLDYELHDVYITKRYPIEIYDRLFAPLYLPGNIERILYLDPDIIIKDKLDDLYNLDFQGKLFAGASHTKDFLNYINKKRLKLNNDIVYINTGVLLMNLQALRKTIEPELIINTIKENHNRLILPDQDIITILYGDQIIEIDTMIYNLSDRILSVANLLNNNFYTKKWVADNVKIIHYCGRNKPWHKHYLGSLDVYYYRYYLAFSESFKPNT